MPGSNHRRSTSSQGKSQADDELHDQPDLAPLARHVLVRARDHQHHRADRPRQISKFSARSFCPPLLTSSSPI